MVSFGAAKICKCYTIFSFCSCTSVLRRGEGRQGSTPQMDTLYQHATSTLLFKCDAARDVNPREPPQSRLTVCTLGVQTDSYGVCSQTPVFTSHLASNGMYLECVCRTGLRVCAVRPTLTDQHTLL